jgi:hypothetical protein
VNARPASLSGTARLFPATARYHGGSGDESRAVFYTNVVTVPVTSHYRVKAP